MKEIDFPFGEEVALVWLDDIAVIGTWPYLQSFDYSFRTIITL